MEKKVMFLCHGAGNGGAERVITTLANKFIERGYSVLLVTTKISENEYSISDQIDRIVIESKKSTVLGRTIDRIMEIRRCLKDYSPKCVISFSAIPNIQVLFASIGLKTKVIISERTDPSRYPESYIGKALRAIMYRFANKIVFQTKDAQKYFSKRIIDNSIIIPNPVREDLPNRFLGEREKKIVGIGSLGEQKNWVVALKACEIFFKKHEDYKMVIFGEGPNRNELESFIKNNVILKNRVFLPGFSSEAVEYMNNAMIYVSSSDYEGISNSMLEALATGVPTICTDCPVGGAKQFIKNNVNGILINVGNYHAMADAMTRIADNIEFADALSNESIKIREELKIDNIVDIWEREVELCE